MPDLKQLLAETLPFTAARGAGIDLFSRRLAAAAPVTVPEPVPVPVKRTAGVITNPGVIDTNPIWQWVHSPSAPSRFTAVTCKPRGMGLNYAMAMPVCDSIDFGDVQVTLMSNGSSISLPLQQAFLAAKFSLPQGTVGAAKSGFWRLPSETDQSLLLLFAFEVSGGSVVPLPPAKLDALGSELMPEVKPPDVAFIDEIVNATIGPPRFLVAMSLTCCKERPDFEPGEVLGAARIYPHVMVVSNTSLTRIESTVTITRPAKTMPHDPEMMSDIGALYFEDTNTDHSLGPGLPLPLWDNFFDYYDLDPLATFGSAEVAFVDRKKPARSVTGGIQRASRDLNPFNEFYEANTTFHKVAGQGEFDNIHLAPRMQMTHKTPLGVSLQFSDIRMAPFCVHDCLHMHTRWGKPTASVPMAVQGFRGDNSPYDLPGGALVPSNQSVFIKLMSPTSFRYRAVAEGAMIKGKWQCFMHHGLAYASDIAPNLGEVTFAAARAGVAAFASSQLEPFGALDPTTSVAAFYFRLRFGGFVGNVLERIKIVDLAKCRM